MKKFERFIVYPLLFIALFQSFVGLKISLADVSSQKSNNVATFDEIEAKKINIINDLGEMVLSAGSFRIEEGGGGFITVLGRTNTNDFPSKIHIMSNNGYANIQLSQSWNYLSGVQEITIESSEDVNFIAIKYPESDIFATDLSAPKKNENGFGATFNIYNPNGAPLVSSGLTTAGHGGVFIFNKNGESYTSYTFDEDNCYNNK